MRIAIYTDPLMGKGGGSKVAIELANNLNADIITAGFDERLRPELNRKVKIINIGNLSIKYIFSLGFLFEAPLRYMFYRNYNYDINIFLGNYSIFAARKKQKNIWFCFTPNRLMYDLKDWKFKNSTLAQKIVYFIHNNAFYWVDQYKAKNFFLEIVAQTNNVQRRIKQYYHKDSKVIYSPLDISNYKFEKYGDFFLTVARLVPEKRIDLIAQCFTKAPKNKLIIVGNGPERLKIQRIIKNYSNISMLNGIDDEKLNELYSTCLATIYMPINEDFGLIPLEGMASGKPCIAANEGGCKETVINNKTGFLVTANEISILEYIKKLDAGKAVSMQKDCIEQAKIFDIHLITNQWKELLKKHIS